jgi:hypothetical protein
MNMSCYGHCRHWVSGSVEQNLGKVWFGWWRGEFGLGNLAWMRVCDEWHGGGVLGHIELRFRRRWSRLRCFSFVDRTQVFLWLGGMENGTLFSSWCSSGCGG